ncbi:HAD family hydrolase [Planctomicrobium sp. SH668]|uniref:HAD family hydrolase n=1 Tax=Planctomicrobium sp. SH668 TaxID=3448126 RepID=UPI003F5B596C
MMSDRVIRTLLCDLGNVLCFFSHEKMCQQVADVCNVPVESVRKTLLQGQMQWNFERGLITEIELKQQLENEFNCRINLGQLVRALGDIFELNDSMIPLLLHLKRRRTRLVLLSNTCVSHINFIQSRWNILGLFDHMILSYEVGTVKPEDRIFEIALDQVQCDPEEVLYIDDIAQYIEKGRLFGMNAEIFTTTDRLIETLPKYGIQYSPQESKPTN